MCFILRAAGLWIISLVWFPIIRSVTAQQQSRDPVENTNRIIGEILSNVAHSLESSKRSLTDRPFVTLSFAQSLDGKLAPFQNENNRNTTEANFALSGPESLLLTHALRSLHDGILVGGKTLSIDNPRLNNRLWIEQGSSHGKQPRPIVLDPTLRHIQKISQCLRAQNPLVFCSKAAIKKSPENQMVHPDLCELVPCELLKNGQLDLKQVLRILKTRYKIHSLMVEGGALVLSSFMELRLFDSLCITIAPCIIGNGISITTSDRIHLGTLNPLFKVCARQLGIDCIFYTDVSGFETSR